MDKKDQRKAILALEDHVGGHRKITAKEADVVDRFAKEVLGQKPYRKPVYRDSWST